MTGQVQDVEGSERIIVNNIGRFNNMVVATVMDEENRVGLLEEIRAIRDRHQLFPISVEIQEQVRLLLEYGPGIEFPDEQISLRSSQIEIQMDLLHEEDLTRFLDDFLGSGRLMINNSCSIRELLISENNFLKHVEHQTASCEFQWYTLRREPYTGE
jgi:hypothetical protein